MCDYCEQDKTMMEIETISSSSWGWGGADTKISEDDAITINLAVFIDRGFLRLVNLDDCQCIEGGERFKVNFCPNCGNKIED